MLLCESCICRHLKFCYIYSMQSKHTEISKMKDIRTQLQIANESIANAMRLIAMLRAARG